MIFCLVCGVGNRAGSRFCNACGRPVGEVVPCEGCGTPNPPGSRYCNECGATLGPPQLAAPREPRALGVPEWRERLALAATLGTDDATWSGTPPGPQPARSITGIEPLSAEDLAVFALPAVPPPEPRHPASAAATPLLARARSWDVHRGPTSAPAPVAIDGSAGLALLLERIVGREPQRTEANDASQGTECA